MFRKGWLETLWVHFGPHFGIILEPSSLLYSLLVAPVVKTCRHVPFLCLRGSAAVFRKGEERKHTLGTPVEGEEEEEGDISHA